MMRVLIDTNILLRIADSSHASHRTAADAVQSLRTQGNDLLIVPQVIYEFWSVTTRTLASNGLGKSTAYAESMILQFCSLFRLLKDERSIYETWLQLVARHAVNGVKSFDARLAAAMLRHNVTHLLTFNSGDFRRYSHVTIIEPGVVIEGFRES